LKVRFSFDGALENCFLFVIDKHQPTAFFLNEENFLKIYQIYRFHDQYLKIAV
jgi:hypothetical protein